MELEVFQETLRSFIRREPFVPFVVELLNGEQIVVAEPTVAFNGGFAGYFSPSYDILEFRCEQVQAIRLLSREAAS